MQAASLVVIYTAALWLVAVGVFMAVRPHSALAFLRQTAATWRINIAEQGLRLLAGAALVVRAPSSKFPQVFEIGGWFIVASSVVLLLIPLRLHAGYAIWWSNALPPWAVRVIAPLSIAAGAGLVAASA